MHCDMLEIQDDVAIVEKLKLRDIQKLGLCEERKPKRPNPEPKRPKPEMTRDFRH